MELNSRLGLATLIASFWCTDTLLAAEDPSSTVAVYCQKEFHLKTHGATAVQTSLCSKLMLNQACISEKGDPIPQYQKEGTAKSPIRILVFGQIHGDEFDAGALAFNWIERLDALSPKNTWRVVPRLNPDGFHLKTRTNAHSVDLNRNFPTKDWDELAVRSWKLKEHSNPRRNPGSKGGSEAETQCALRQIEDFRPDIIVSIHSPYGLLDFDGKAPQVRPKFGLPWKDLGTFPGSLGRYMWAERQVPVLTIELAPTSLKSSRAEFDRLQDYISLLAPKGE